MDFNVQLRQNLTLLLPFEARTTALPKEIQSVSLKTSIFSPPSESSEAHLKSAKPPDGVEASSPRSKSQHRRHASSFNNSLRPDTRHESLQNADIVFSPRPYENLYIEWAYCTASIQQQTARRADLMRQYSQAEVQHQSLEVSKERRKLRKRLGLLKSKIKDTIEQEKAVFVRLCELYVEIQSRDAWAQASLQGPGFLQLPIPQTPSYSLASPMSCDIHTPITPLNGGSPEFIPKGYFEYFHNPCSGQVPGDLDNALETVVEEGEGTSHSLERDSRHPESDKIPKTCDVEDDWTGARLGAFRTRRFSLPSLPTGCD